MPRSCCDLPPWARARVHCRRTARGGVGADADCPGPLRNVRSGPKGASRQCRPGRCARRRPGVDATLVAGDGADASGQRYRRHEPLRRLERPALSPSLIGHQPRQRAGRSLFPLAPEQELVRDGIPCPACELERNRHGHRGPGRWNALPLHCEVERPGFSLRHRTAAQQSSVASHAAEPQWLEQSGQLSAGVGWRAAFPHSRLRYEWSPDGLQHLSQRQDHHQRLVSGPTDRRDRLQLHQLRPPGLCGGRDGGSGPAHFGEVPGISQSDRRIELSGAAGRRGPPVSTTYPRPNGQMNRKSQHGIALVITLIMLAVVTVMAVLFLGISLRERPSVNVTANLTDARLAADAAQARALSELIGQITAQSNLFAYDFRVSTNFISPSGFNPNLATPNLTNVSYTYASGQLLNNDTDIRKNLLNLYYDPRPPVFVVTNITNGATDFRFYLDLNRNGRFDTNGFQRIINTNGVVLRTSETSFYWGDPEWIGILEHPD